MQCAVCYRSICMANSFIKSILSSYRVGKDENGSRRWFRDTLINQIDHTTTIKNHITNKAETKAYGFKNVCHFRVVKGSQILFRKKNCNKSKEVTKSIHRCTDEIKKLYNLILSKSKLLNLGADDCFYNIIVYKQHIVLKDTHTHISCQQRAVIDSTNLLH